MPELPIAEAAAALGISLDVCRARVRRGLLQSVKRGNRVYVLVPDTEASASRHDESASSQSGPDTRRDSSVSSERLDADVVAALIAQLEAQREQLAEANQRLAEAHAIIARLAQRPPELAPPVAPQAPQEAHSEPTEGRKYAAPRTSSPARRPWWRRWGTVIEKWRRMT